MMNGVDSVLVRKMERCAAILGALAACAGAVCLLGWTLGVPALKSVIPGLATMKINTALSLCACGAALFLKAGSEPRRSRSRIAEAIAAVAVVVAALTLVEYALHVNLHIDELLGRDPETAARGGDPGRMSHATAVCILCIGLALTLLDRATRFGQILAIVALAISVLALLGYAYGIAALYRITPFSSMALHTAAALAAVSFGHLIARPRRCVHHLFVSATAGGRLARTLLPATALVPLLAGWMCLAGIHARWYDIEFGLALLALGTMLILAGFVWWNASALDRSDARRKRLEADRDRLLECERAARGAAEHALAARDQLLSIVSHELRTPLTPAMLIATSLAQQSHLPVEIREDLSLIREQIHVETRLIDDLLNLVGLRQGKLTLDRTDARFDELVRKTTGLFQRRFAEKGVAFQLDFQAGDARVEADAARFQQVLGNLLDNALKFTGAGGTVSVRSFVDQGQHACVEVRDSGVGIAPEAIDRIFEPFQQADGSTTRRFGGLGIGLTIARMIADLHGGSIRVASAGADRGAAFSFRLPIASGSLRDPPPNSDSSGAAFAGHGSRQAMNILLVEDDPETQRTLGRILRTFGHTVLLASDARQALERIASSRIDLLICDIGLPDMSGWELLRAVREKSRIPAIAISGFVAAEDRSRSRDCGFSVHLAKPLELKDLEEAIHITLDPRASESRLNDRK